MNNIEMFGAIRRAVEYARFLERDQDEKYGRDYAYYIRCSIRKAINSKKESFYP